VGSLTEDAMAALRRLRAVLPEADILVVGATALARHIPFDYRTSDDLDLVLGVTLEGFREAASELADWQRSEGPAEHRFHTDRGLQLDLVPAGNELRAQGFVPWGDGFEMNLLGFDLAFAHAERVTLEAGLEVLFPPPAVIALLKISAWTDRPERGKDLLDLDRLMQDYLEHQEDRRWDELAALEADYEAQSPFALGLDLGRLVEDADRALVESFLANPPGRLGPDDAAWRIGDRPEKEAARLAAFRRGFDRGLAER